MRGKNVIITMLVAIVIILVAGFSFMYGKGYIGTTSPIYNEQGKTFVVTKEVQAQDNFHLGNYFTENFPVFFDVVSDNCGLAHGTWVQQKDKIGCYDVPVWNYTTTCMSGEVVYMRQICITAKGVFTCNEHEASCEV